MSITTLADEGGRGVFPTIISVAFSATMMVDAFSLLFSIVGEMEELITRKEYKP
ncbi:MAG: hypothetical protein QS721_12590 [Candidatus Endonucleobacter sp. (ex Gigantidas childressi)]|nr:hypothetical protein [Candidatus Endonucleobacter sp. (ex Gigantidas childressi)]